MRISRIDAFGGSCPAVNPSIYICPPFGPADGPASACRSDNNSSGSSGSASSSFPESVIAPALLFGFTSTVGAFPDADTVSVYCPAARLLNSYAPCPLLFTTIGDPVAGVMITLAPGIAAPDGSLTCPYNDPPPCCANDETLNHM